MKIITDMDHRVRRTTWEELSIFQHDVTFYVNRQFQPVYTILNQNNRCIRAAVFELFQPYGD